MILTNTLLFSCSIICRKEAPNSKCLVTEERMAAKMEGLSLDGMAVGTSPINLYEQAGYQLPPNILHFDFNDMVSSSTTCSTISDGWKRFNDIENRSNNNPCQLVKRIWLAV